MVNERASLAGTERGAIMVETSIAFGVVLLILVTTFELLRFGHSGLATQFLLSKYSRIAVVGDAQSGPERAANIKAQLISYGKILGVELDQTKNPNVSISICPSVGFCEGGLDVGTGGGYFTIRISESFKMLFNTIEIPSENVILARNEPF